MDINTRHPDSLTPHPLSEEIYGDQELDSLIKSIGQNGIEDPNGILTQSHFVDNTREVILSGHRRTDAANQLGLDEVPVVIENPFDSKLADRVALIEHNNQRVKAFSRWMREAKGLVRIEPERVKKRRERTIKTCIFSR